MATQLAGTYVGFVIDNDPETPPIAGMLTVSDEEIRLEMPMVIEATAAYEKWFESGGLPASLLFKSTDRRFSLTNMRWRQQIPPAWKGYGKAVLEARQIVETGESQPVYAELSGLHSELVGLPVWLNPKVFKQDGSWDSEGRTTSVTFTALEQQKVIIPGVDGLMLSPYWDTVHDYANGTHTMRETTQIETLYDTARSWHDHEMVHQTLQDLVSIAFWKECDLTVHRVLRSDDQIMTVDRRLHGVQWVPALSPTFGRRPRQLPAVQLPTNERPLFYFDDIGAAGVQKWYAEYERLKKSMKVLSSNLFRRGGTLEMQLQQVGGALEALGYEILVAKKKTKRGDKFYYTQALRAIFDDTDCQLDKVLAGDSVDEWVAHFNAAYKGVKHADNPWPQFDDLYYRLNQGSLLARLWLARYLGVERKVLEEQRLPGVQF